MPSTSMGCTLASSIWHSPRNKEQHSEYLLHGGRYALVHSRRRTFLFVLVFFFITDNYGDNKELDPVHEFARIFGTEHPWFWRVHLTALVSLG